ncbi:MAG: YqgE/AlgH family protein [Akkermansiaceae bacterium]
MNIPAHSFNPPINGSLLLASPSLQDGVFDDSVILVHTHRSTGAEGLILNRPTGKTVGDYMCSNHFETLKNLPLYYGGPVAEDQLSFASFSWKKNGDLKCKPSISSEEAIETMSQSGSLIRAYLGSSNWTKGQLEKELENYVWFIAPAIPKLLSMPQDETLWKNTMQVLSPFHHIISLTPENPFLN